MKLTLPNNIFHGDTGHIQLPGELQNPPAGVLIGLQFHIGLQPDFLCDEGKQKNNQPVKLPVLETAYYSHNNRAKINMLPN